MTENAGLSDDRLDWLRTQIRFAGEELIRRSENMDLLGFDVLTDLEINVKIPTYNGSPEAPSIKFTFSALNKVAADDMIGRNLKYKFARD